MYNRLGLSNYVLFQGKEIYKETNWFYSIWKLPNATCRIFVAATKSFFDAQLLKSVYVTSMQLNIV